ncbi:unnamed protein product [Triticum turgidum subsp. durum]|uniref:GATA-type domain-containing protein n=1 Tax=Triticum turgidum subsp. durum TaxID=4567 RepID=A0A9R0YVQ9_TRITD|nr:unnamed protein product [Triticum turgidum subsp. durum]
MASGRFMEEMMREHEQSLLEATCGGLFDHIEDLLDFPKEDSAADVLLLDAPVPDSPLAARVLAGGAPPPAPASLEQQQQQAASLLVPPPPLPAGDHSAAFLGALGDTHLQCDELDMDMAQLEWLSGLFDDTSIPHEPAFACAAPIIRASALSANAGVVLPDKMEDALFRSSSPTSVLEDGGANNANMNMNNNSGGSSASSTSSSASSSSESFSGSGRPWSVPLSPRPEPPVLVIPARARSKRSRASAFPAAIRAAVPAPEATILVPTPMFSSTSSYSEEPECIAESNSQPKKKKKAKRPTPPVTSDAEGDADYEEGSGGAALAPGEVRRCTHCQIDKTPQWRAGPLGPKTLCNACGVRYKSGRLFPEYRPAASPTFVPAIHSNSHKKVVEMRQKVEPKGDDLLQFIRRRD